LHTHTSTVETTVASLTALFEELKENVRKELDEINTDRKLFEHEKRQQDQKSNDQKQKLIEQEEALKSKRQTLEDDQKKLNEDLNNQKQKLIEQEEALKSERQTLNNQKQQLGRQRQAFEDDRQKLTKDVDVQKQELEDQKQKLASKSKKVRKRREKLKAQAQALEAREEACRAREQILRNQDEVSSSQGSMTSDTDCGSEEDEIVEALESGRPCPISPERESAHSHTSAQAHLEAPAQIPNTEPAPQQAAVAAAQAAAVASGAAAAAVAATAAVAVVVQQKQQQEEEASRPQVGLQQKGKNLASAGACTGAGKGRQAQEHSSRLRSEVHLKPQPTTNVSCTRSGKDSAKHMPATGTNAPKRQFPAPTGPDFKKRRINPPPAPPAPPAPHNGAPPSGPSGLPAAPAPQTAQPHGPVQPKGPGASLRLLRENLQKGLGVSHLSDAHEALADALAREGDWIRGPGARNRVITSLGNLGKHPELQEEVREGRCPADKLINRLLDGLKDPIILKRQEEDKRELDASRTVPRQNETELRQLQNVRFLQERGIRYSQSSQADSQSQSIDVDVDVDLEQQ
jgi:hypothetical protein